MEYKMMEDMSEKELREELRVNLEDMKILELNILRGENSKIGYEILKKENIKIMKRLIEEDY